jgi:outer membrane receptor protein involved in Fe transport
MRTPNLGRKAALSQAILIALGGSLAQTEALAQAQDQNTNQEQVIVTGSRIARRDYTSQSPIVTIEAEAFTERANIGLEATLNQLPQFNTTDSGTQSTFSPSDTPFPSASAAPGAATVNLRGLGLNRSLILVDGKRVQPVNGQLVVDLNTIPAAAIERVEVITGGAAAVYGADAIAGVVNFILKKDFEGLQFSSQFGSTGQGDGEELSIDGLFGADFSDGSGNVMLGANYSRREIIYGRDRDWVRKGWFDPGTVGGGLGQSNLSSLGAATTNFIDQNGNVFDSADPLNPARPYTGPLGGESGFKINPDGSLGYNDFANTGPTRAAWTTSRSSRPKRRVTCTRSSAACGATLRSGPTTGRGKPSLLTARQASMRINPRVSHTCLACRTCSTPISTERALTT